jgi:hypothetical protein
MKLSWIYDAAARGDIPGKVRLGGHLRFRREAILSWLAALEAPQAANRSFDGRVVDRAARLVAHASPLDAGVHGVSTVRREAKAAAGRRLRGEVIGKR